MIRYLTPLLFALGTGWMWHYNRTQDSSRLLVPFIDVLAPGLAGDPLAQADRSLLIMVILTGVITGWTILDHLRDVRRRPVEPDEA